MILGRATHALLRWRLECGERIGVLDTLAASTSLTSTVVSQFQLRTFSAFGIALILVWALSPIGGQASLRQMTIGTKNTTFPGTFSYMVHNGYTTGFLNTARESHWQMVDSLFLSGIIGSHASRSSPLDNWGNVKIPRLEYYEDWTSPDHDGWFQNTDSYRPDIYTSMIGIPISETDSYDFIDYQTHIHTSYLHIFCSQQLIETINLGMIMQPDMDNIIGPGAVILLENSTLSLRARRNPESLSPLQFQYITRTWGEDNYKLVCNLTSSYVEAQVHCPQRGTSCTVNQLRRSQLDSPPPAWSLLDLGMPAPNLLFQQILNSARNKVQTPTLLDKYLSDPASVLLPGGHSPVFASVPLTDEANYSIRLTQLFNSYFTAMNGMYAIAGGLTQETAYFEDKRISFVPQLTADQPPESRNDSRWFAMTGDGNLTAKAWPAEGTKAVSTQVIVAHMAWVVTLCVTSILLIVASLVSPLVHFFLLRGPDVMMNISSLATRHNPYIPLPEGGTNLGASDRARLLKGLELRFGDVELGSGVGHLAIGTVGGKGGEEIARIRKGKLYE